MELIHKYFPAFTPDQYRKFELLSDIYIEWNQKINVISRNDIRFLYERHVLYSLSIARFIKFVPDTFIADIGTGGGFPGIPLAIAFPKVRFILIDSISKKIRVVNEVVNHIELKNVSTLIARAESINIKCDFIISRAVAALPEFYKMTSHLLNNNSNNAIPNGIIYLKGGEFEQELKPLSGRLFITSIYDYFQEAFFETKKIVYISQDKKSRPAKAERP